ncbi:MAG: OmpH family outer membrane protein [Puniceicoccales bacterium]|jgi:Skp family chaperone for outer membrane proteins|nr:OmpH family outer membrane protein [Puniceicoccales bacterium]
MKRLLTILSLFGLACASAQAQTAPRIVTVDVQVVFEKYDKAQHLHRALSDSLTRARQEDQAYAQRLQAKEGEVRQAQEQAQNSALNEQGKINARTILEQRYREYQALRSEAETKGRNAESVLRNRQQNNQTDIIASLKPVVEAIAKAKGANLVLSSTFSPAGVLFADKSLDITDEVVKKLNADYAMTPGAAAAAAATPAPAPAPAPAAPGTAAPAPAPATPAPAAPAAGGLAPLPTITR